MTNQMLDKSFKYKTFLEIKRLPLEKVSEYYRQLRCYEFEANKPMKSSAIKKRCYAVTKLVLKVDRWITGRELILFDDKRKNDIDGGKVFAAAHVGRYDIESVLEAIGEQAYFIMGDPGETYRNFEGFFLDKICGRISFDTGHEVSDLLIGREYGGLPPGEKALLDEYKKDRHICEVTATRRIRRGDNVLIFPEGAWNITPRMVQSLFPGAVRIALNGGGAIVPIGVLRDGKEYSVNIGREMDVRGAELDDVRDITRELKERICGLTGEMIFHQGLTRRSSLKSPEENERLFVEDIMKESENGYTVEVIEKTRYYDADYPENVFKATNGS